MYFLLYQTLQNKFTQKMVRGNGQLSSLGMPLLTVNPPPPIGHALFRALQNPGACPKNAICVFPVWFLFSKDLLLFFHRKKVFLFFFFSTFFLPQRIYVFFPQKKSFFVFFFSILKIKKVSKIMWVKQM